MQFISKDWELYRFTPYVRPFPEKHSGKNISLSLDSMIEELGLTSLDINMFSVNDNASNMKLGIKMSHYLSEYNCDIHTLELVIKDSVTGSPNVVEVLKKLKLLQSM